jgi:serine protease Do
MASNVVTRVVDQLKEFGETRRGWLGVRIQDVTQDVADAMGLAKVTGALITDVPDGPAKDAGLKTGDVIMSFAGVEVEDTRGLVRQVGNSAVGAAVRVTVLRDGKSQTLKVILGRREDAEGESTPGADPEEGVDPEGPETASILGLTVTPLTDDMREEFDADEATNGLAVVEVDETSEAFEKGLRKGDVITEAGQQSIATISDLEDRVTEARDAGRKSLLLLVRRAGDPRFVAIGIEE